MKKIRHRVGNVLYYLGVLGLPLGVGAMLGYYAADQGMRWMPTMLRLFLVVCMASLLAISLGRWLEGSSHVETPGGKKLRKRVTFCLVLAALLILTRLSIFWLQSSSPLTDLTPEQYNALFTSDLQAYDEFDTGLSDQLAVVQRDLDFLDGADNRMLTREEEKLLRELWAAFYDYAFAMDQVRLFHQDWFRFDPSRAQRSYHLRSFLLTFAADLSLYEKSYRLADWINRNENAVKFLNAPPAGEIPGRNAYSFLCEQMHSLRDQSRLLAGKEYLLWLEKGLDGRNEAEALGCGPLWHKVEMELQLIEAVAPIDFTSMNLGTDINLFKRQVSRVWFPAQKGVAEWMGHQRVLKESGTYMITDAQLETMDPFLEPGDILIVRKNWHLSNVGLPGFWPHAVLYIGSAKKSTAYFDDPEVREWLRNVTGKEISFPDYLASQFPEHWIQYSNSAEDEPVRVIEAVDPRVLLHTLAQANGDYLAAMRPRLNRLAKAQAIVVAFSHLEKPYDYNFDFATDHALVCTELVWRSYRPGAGKKGLTIDLVTIAGRKTLPANELASLYSSGHAQDDAQLEFVYFLDATEAADETFVSDEAAFRKSCKRSKWSFALD